MANNTEPDEPRRAESDELSFEPLAGSGFEADEPDSEFNDFAEEA